MRSIKSLNVQSLAGLLLAGVAFGSVAISAPAAARAQAAFTVKPIVVGGNANVDATSINDFGSAVATLFDAEYHPIGGVVLNGSSVIQLPPPYAGSGPAQPKMIDNAGNVLGYTVNLGLNIPDMFLLRSGVADPNYDIALIEPFGTQGLTIPNPIGFAAGKIIFYTRIISLSAPTDPSYGVPPNLRTTPEFNNYQTIKSVNASAMVAGVAYGLGGPKSVFLGRGDAFQLLTPPGAVSVFGGYINDSGMVAGSYTDTAGAPHGFVYTDGTYKTFDMPTPAQSITVTAISSTGRVAGSYAGEGNGVQHIFRYNGSTVSTFASVPGGDTVAVALNAHERMLVAVQSGLLYRSYAVTCSGAGC